MKIRGNANIFLRFYYTTLRGEQTIAQTDLENNFLLLNVDETKNIMIESVPAETLVMPKIAGSWLNDKCINNACWFHNVVTKNNCGNEEMNEDITGCSPRGEHKQLLNEIVGKKKADKISSESNFSA